MSWKYNNRNANTQFFHRFISLPRDGEHIGSDSRWGTGLLPHVHGKLRNEKRTKGTTPNKPTHTRWIHLSQSVAPHPLPPVLLPASLFSIKCQDWPFYNHICDWGSGIQMQSMSIRMKGLLIEKGEMVWGILPLFILANTVITFKPTSWDLNIPVCRLMVIYRHPWLIFTISCGYF